MRKFVYVGTGMAAIAAACMAVWRAHADEGFSDQINVVISSLATEPRTIYTPNGELQNLMPIGVRTLIGREPEAFGEVLDPALSVEVTTGGTVEVAQGVPEVVDPSEAVTGELLLQSPTGGTHLSVINASLLDFTETDLGGVQALVAQDLLRSVAVVDNYYVAGETTTELAEEIINLTVLDAALVDGDENGIPDATALLEPFTWMMGPDDRVSVVLDLGSLDRGTPFNGNFTVDLRSDDGPIQVIVDAPTLQQLAAANAAYNMYAGRLIMTLSDDAQDLIDLPEGTDPAAEFNLGNPEPQGLFIRTVIALTGEVDLRGAAPQWTFLGDLPGGLDIELEVSGPGVQNQLNAGDEGFGYFFDANVVQSGEDILVEAGSGWSNLPTIEIADFYNGDDFSRGGNTVETDDDTIFITFGGASGIYASNVMPRVSSRGGGGGGGGCFIATAAYGTPMAREIESLRGVRDTYLIDSALGAAFVDAYYRISPSIAALVAESPAAKAVVRAALVPVVALIAWTMAAPKLVATGVGLLALLAAMTGARRKRRAA